MIKKIALLALTVSAAFSGVWAQTSECSVTLTGSKVYTGAQIKPTISSVECDGELVADYSIVSWGENIDVGDGSVVIALSDGSEITKTFKIAQKDISIKIDDLTKEKGEADPEFTWTMDEVKGVKEEVLNAFIEGLNDLIKLEREKGEDVANKDGVPIEYKIALAKGVPEEIMAQYPNFNVMVEPGKFTISKMKVHIVVTGSSKTYGKTDPKLEYSLSSNFETLDLDEIGKIELVRDEGENVGAYTINVTIDGKQYRDRKKTENGCEPEFCKETDNYYVYVVSGIFGITAADVTVAVDDVTKVYGSATPAFTYKATGLVGEDQLKDVEITCAKCSTTDLENVGEYAVSASVNAKSNPNYKVTTTDGTLTVTPKAASVTLEDTTKVYGDKDPKFTYTTEGLVEGQALEGVTITRAEGEDVGSYKVNMGFAEGSNTNYKLTVLPSTLTVTQKEVTLKVTDITKKYGEKDPELDYTVEGIVKFGDEEDVLKGVALKREAGEDAGEYAITASVDAKSNPNYIVSTEGGTLTITANNDKIVVTIKGSADTLQYDGKEHTLKGFEISTNSEAYSLKFVEYTGDSIVTGKDAGKFTMGLDASAFKNTSANYTNVTFNITDGVLQIDPRALVVTAKADTITFGDEIPTEFTWAADSLLEGDSLDNIHVSINKTGRLDAGNYALAFDKKAPTTKNYTVTKYVADSLTVLPKSVVVTVNDTSKFYSEADPEKFTYKVDGLLEGDTLPELVLKRQAGEDVLPDDESYAISAGFAKEGLSANYKVKIRQGEFTIKPYMERITVAIYGDNVVAMYDEGKDVTIKKSFDVSPMRIPGEPWLPDELAYRKEFVAYKGDTTMTEKELGVYSMGLVATDFENISPNFGNVHFVVTIDGTFKITDQETSIAGVKGVKAFGLSAMNRGIQVSGSTVGKRYAVVDLQGRVIRKGVVETSNFEIPVPNTGIYMVRIGTSTQRIRVK